MLQRIPSKRERIEAECAAALKEIGAEIITSEHHGVTVRVPPGKEARAREILTEHDFIVPDIESRLAAFERAVLGEID